MNDLDIVLVYYKFQLKSRSSLLAYPLDKILGAHVLKQTKKYPNKKKAT